jgi:hypothetical protein
MQRFRLLAALVIALTLMAPISGTAQTFSQSINLRDLLLDFLRAGITLAPPTQGPSHVAHFIGADSPQFIALQQFNGVLANQLSAFPLASSGGGFTYRYDANLGVFTRTTDSFGPIFAERAATIGKGKLNIGVNYNHFSFSRIDDLQLRDGDLRLVFTHADVNNDHSNLEPFVEGDVITAQLYLKVETSITAFVLTYGITDRFDVEAAIPVVRVDINALSNATIQHLSTTGYPDIHRFQNGGSTETFRQSGSASGVGDVVLRAKYDILRGSRGGLGFLADVRLPTGEERDLLGTGATEAKGLLIGSLRFGTFSPHINAGYTWAFHQSASTPIADEINYTAGFDWGLSPKLTVAVDVLGRDFRNTSRVRVVNNTYQANTNPDPTTPPTIVTATFPALTVEPVDNLNTLTGSVGVKINPFGNLLLTVNGLFSLNRNGLQTRFAPLVGLDYSF